MILRTPLFFAVALVLLLCTATIIRSAIYSDEMSLWSDAIAKSPNKARPLTMVGLEFQKKFDDRTAIMYFERAAKLHPDFPEAINNLADLYGKSGNRDRAVELLRGAVYISPDNLTYRSNLAIMYFSNGMLDKAEYEYNIIIQLAPQSPEAGFARQMLHEIQKVRSGN